MLSALYRYVEAQTTTNWTQTSRDKSWYWLSSCLHPCTISSIYNISYRQQGGWKASSAIHDLVVGFITDHAVFARRHRAIEKKTTLPNLNRSQTNLLICYRKLLCHKWHQRENVGFDRQIAAPRHFCLSNYFEFDLSGFTAVSLSETKTS